YYYREGRRVSVTINGGGDIAGAGGGVDQITLTAGGTRRDAALSTTNLSAAPTFAATRSRCGGNFGLLVDTSGSIGTNISYVRSGLTAFINAFAGTPIKLQAVQFSSVANTMGAGTSWGRYFDMLVDSDVAALKSLVTALASSGSTNWEDALFRMFRNADGSVQQVLPDTLIFFTDGMPTYNRLNDSTAKTTSPAVMDPDDTGLPTAAGSSYNQMSWNRANRIARVYEADLEKFIGVFVGTDVTGSSTWQSQGPGYHLANLLRGYHDTWEQGYHLANVQRGYHTDYKYSGTGLTYQYAASGLTFQYSTTGLTYEYAATGLKFEKKSGSTWSTITAATYFTSNSTTDSTDNYRVTVTGTLGSWTTINATASTAKTQYDKTNTIRGDTDGFRARVSGTVGPTWTSTTKALFDLSNAGADSTDGFRIVVGTLGTTWTSTTKALYDVNNALAGSTDGFRTTVTGALGSYVLTTQAYYNLNNTTADASDGYTATVVYSSPYSQWEAVSDATYLANNTTADNTDGWDATTSYTAPFNYWTSITQAVYNAHSSDPAYRVSHAYSTPYSGWESTTEAAYTTSNTVWGNTDGWDATKVYTEPYTFHEGYTSISRKNTDILKQIVAPGGVVPAIKSGTTYTNSKEATYYELPTWAQFAGAMTSMALAECGGTVTLQTKIGSASAADPFTYQSSVDKSTATTSAQFKSGTFDFDLAGGASQTVTISPFSTSDLTHYNPVGWSCKAGGANYAFTTANVDGGPWQSLTLTVSPNQAISCIYSVTLK
ncbi:MAG: vWA domain-containing protein, partial [Actinomycetota bacterium]